MDDRQRAIEADLDQTHWWFAARRAIVRRLLQDVVPPNAGNLIVDVGCGTGATLANLQDRYAVLGVDPSSHAIDTARARFPDVAFRHGALPDALNDLQLRPAAFLLMDVLEHVDDDRTLLANAVEMLDPQGIVLATVPADLALWSPHDYRLGHRRRYEPRSLRRLWEGFPVQVRLLSFFNRRLLPLARAVRIIQQLRTRVLPADSSDLEMHPRFLNPTLHRIFRGEAKVLARALKDGGRGYSAGVSLIAILEKLPVSKVSHAGGRRSGYNLKEQRQNDGT